VRLKGLGKLKKEKINDPIGTQIRDFPACSIAPQIIYATACDLALWIYSQEDILSTEHTGIDVMLQTSAGIPAIAIQISVWFSSGPLRKRRDSNYD
jgi:hypothetical protein